MFIQITRVWAYYFKFFNWVQSTQDEKARFIKGNELKLTQVELFSFLFFKTVMTSWANLNISLTNYPVVSLYVEYLFAIVPSHGALD